MTIDRTGSAWAAMDTEANERALADGRRRVGIGLAIAVVRTAALVILATVAILVVLPALLSAQAALVL